MRVCGLERCCQDFISDVFNEYHNIPRVEVCAYHIFKDMFVVAHAHMAKLEFFGECKILKLSQDRIIISCV